MALFRFVEANDVFMAFYSKDLAKRLLLGTSSSLELHSSGVSSFRTLYWTCGKRIQYRAMKEE